MTAETIAHSNEHDRLFMKYGGTLSMSKVDEPRCGIRAIYEYAKKTGEPLPMSPERAKEIETILTTELSA